MPLRCHNNECLVGQHGRGDRSSICGVMLDIKGKLPGTIICINRVGF